MGGRRGPGRLSDLVLPVLAVALFVPLFVFRATGPLDFWSSLSLSVVFLAGLGLGLDPAYGPFLRRDLRRRAAFKVLLGLLSAVLLYGVFVLGNLALRRVFPASAPRISGVYALGAGVSRLRIVLLMLFFIGPGEEIFWRGFVQRAWQARFSDRAGWLLTSLLYAGVHAGSGNPVLVLAAAVCGLFWGAMFLRYRSPLMLCVSHTLWDLLAFVIIPFS
jgi:membrane protease YdiL (CAAX protease family)